MIRATLDVNVLASGFPAAAGIPAELIDRWTDLAYELVISEHILGGLSPHVAKALLPAPL